MKLVRFETAGRTALGVLVGEDAVAELPQAGSSMAAFLARGAAGLAEAQAAAQAGKTVPLSSVKLLCPVGDPGKIMCIGQNYKDHCEEQNQPIPERVILFSKFNTALNNPGDPIPLPKASEKVDYEAELAVVIGGAGGGGRHIAVEDALNHVAGYMCAHDVSARDIQLHPAERQWIRGKSPDGFFPCGPYLLTADEVPDPQSLDISLTLNGEVRQSSNTVNLIFNVPFLISHLSQTMTLLPGDIIATGTPGGVGMYSDPPVFLKPGDTVTVTIAKLGSLTNRVVAE